MHYSMTDDISSTAVNGIYFWVTYANEINARVRVALVN